MFILYLRCEANSLVALHSTDRHHRQALPLVCCIYKVARMKEREGNLKFYRVSALSFTFGNSRFQCRTDPEEDGMSSRFVRGGVGIQMNRKRDSEECPGED